MHFTLFYTVISLVCLLIIVLTAVTYLCITNRRRRGAEAQAHIVLRAAGRYDGGELRPAAPPRAARPAGPAGPAVLPLPRSASQDAHNESETQSMRGAGAEPFDLAVAAARLHAAPLQGYYAPPGTTSQRPA